MSLLKTLNGRYTIAKKFTQEHIDEVKRSVSDYNAESTDSTKRTGVHNRHVKTARYDIIIPYIFATHESMIASLFERMMEIVVVGRTGDNDAKVELLTALYQYLVDKCDLESFINESAWWFLLVGFVSSDADWKVEIKDYQPQIGSDGNPMYDENGEQTSIPIYSYNDPVVVVDNPLKTYFGAGSEFSIKAEKVPYLIKEKLVEVDEISEVYGIEVEADEKLDVEGSEDKENPDLDRVKVKYYYGRLPKSCIHELAEQNLSWSYGKQYKAYFTTSKLLMIEEAGEKNCRLAKLFSAPNKFFGYGIGKTLRPFQHDMSMRRSQQLRYADMYAFPWLMINSETSVSQKEIQDYQKRIPLKYSGDKPPEYLTPPPMPDIIPQSDEASRSDAQFVSGTLDLSKGAQQTTTVKTATGQQLFAQSQDKRMQKARKQLAAYYREVVISLFKLCRDNWDESHDPIKYVDESGGEKEIVITRESLEGIDFDTDIDFNIDTVSVNQDILSQRWISLLEQVKDFPFADQQKIFEKVLRESYKITDPENYSREMPVDPMTGQPQMQEPPMMENQEVPPVQQPLGNQLSPRPEYAGSVGI